MDRLELAKQIQDWLESRGRGDFEEGEVFLSDTDSSVELLISHTDGERFSIKVDEL